nr:ECF RNA polymerase sigma factor SigK [Gordonia effusa]
MATRTDRTEHVERTGRQRMRVRADAIEGTRMNQRASAETATLDALLVRVGDGDTAAFSDFYHRTSARTYGLVLRVLRDPGYSEEVLQEVYLNVWRSARSFDSSTGSVMAWLLTIAHRRAVDRVRAEQSAGTRDATYSAATYMPPRDDVADTVVHRSDSAVVVDCLDTLSDAQRLAVESAYYNSRTYREVASDLGLGLSAVKARIRDGLRRLRECVSGVNNDA